MPDVAIRPLVVDDIEELNQSNTLYITDFRALAESPNFQIYEMFGYEDLAHLLVGSRARGSLSAGFNASVHGVHALATNDCTMSVLSRIDDLPKHIESLWMGVAHMDADQLATRHGLSLNYLFSDFQKLNNKLMQKQHLVGTSPAFRVLEAGEALKPTDVDEFQFLKNSAGAGGFGVVDLRRSDLLDFAQLTDRLQDGEWYLERAALGRAQSVQVQKSGSSYTIFGKAVQHIENGTEFYGAELLPLEFLNFELHILTTAIEQMDAAMHSYNGFFGIDFCSTDNTLEVLEFNVRQTSLTVPTLLFNEQSDGSERFTFREGPQVPKDGEVVVNLALLPNADVAQSLLRTLHE